ncbi:MAG: hypothetical protein KF716_09385 [Anaerolineae bacterium]|nr:hypothetical protein [Anaerolineae bacterium]
MAKKLLVLCYMLCSLATITARADAPQPKVLQPSDVFMDAVEVLDTVPVLNISGIDNRMYFLDRDAVAWRDFEHPKLPIDSYLGDEWRGGFIKSLNDHLYLYGGSTYYRFVADKFRVFNTLDGTFSMPDMVCGIVKGLEEDTEIVFYRPTIDAPYYPCFLQTGSLGQALPSAVSKAFCNFESPKEPDAVNIPLSVSPDHKWLLLEDCNFPHSFYSYEVATGKVNFLGKDEMDDDEDIVVQRWADNTHPIIFTEAHRNDAYRALRYADVTRENSLQEIIGDYYPAFEPFSQYFANSRRYLWFPAEFGTNGVPPETELQRVTLENACRLHEFDLQTLEITIYPKIANVCGLGVEIPDGTGDRLYRNILFWHKADGMPQYSAQLVRYSLKTLKSNVLYTEEIEWIDSISPDGRYAVLSLDSDGQLNDDRVMLHPMSSEYKAGGWPYPRLAIVDLNSGKLILRITQTRRCCSLWAPMGQYLAPYIDWYDQDTFYFFERADDEHQPSDPIRHDIEYFQFRNDRGQFLKVYDIVQGKLQKTDSVDLWRLNFGKDRWNVKLTLTAEGQSAVLKLYDNLSKRIIDLTKPLDVNHYTLEYWSDERDIDVTIYDKTLNTVEPFMLRHWHVRIKE